MPRRVFLAANQVQSCVSLAWQRPSARIISHVFSQVQRAPASTVAGSVSTLDKDSTEPVFEIVSSGVGSTLLIKMPPDTVITAVTGAAMGTSSRVTSKLSLDNTALKSVGRRLLGDPMFFQKFYTKRAAGDILLAPPSLGEIATIELRGNIKYNVRRDAFLAKTEKVSLDLGIQEGAGILQKMIHTVSGPGTLAIAHYGQLCRMSLTAGEEYLANPRHLVLWDQRTMPTQLHATHPIVPSPRSPWRRFAVVRNIADSPSMQPRLQRLSSLARLLRNTLLGTPDFVKLKGPGEFVLASRVEPRFERARRMNALAAVNSSASQLFDSASIFPAAPAELLPSAASFSKRVGHPGYATCKSVDGKPSYYAEIDPAGKVVFVANH